MNDKNSPCNAPENKTPEDKKYSIIAVIVIAIIAILLVSNCSCSGSSGSSKCSVCHGTGYYQKKTCVFCNGTGYSDYDPYEHYKSAMGY